MLCRQAINEAQEHGAVIEQLWDRCPVALVRRDYLGTGNVKFLHPLVSSIEERATVF